MCRRCVYFAMEGGWNSLARESFWYKRIVIYKYFVTTKNCTFINFKLSTEGQGRDVWVFYVLWSDDFKISPVLIEVKKTNQICPQWVPTHEMVIFIKRIRGGTFSLTKIFFQQQPAPKNFNFEINFSIFSGYIQFWITSITSSEGVDFTFSKKSS